MEANITSGIDVEVLSILLGLSKAVEISGLSEDSLKRMLGNLKPENHAFSYFIKDCLLQLVNKIGIEAASKKLGVSVPVISAIKTHSTSQYRPPRTSAPEPPINSYEEEMRMQVITTYNTSKSLSQTARLFNIPREQALGYIINISDL